MGKKQSRNWDRSSETERDKRFFDTRESGYTGWLDQDARKVSCPCCHKPGCTAKLTEKCNG